MKKLLVYLVIIALALTLMPAAVSFAEPADAVMHHSEYPLADTSAGNVDGDGNATGYWMHPFVIGDKINVTFETPLWITGFRFYAWCSYSDVCLDLELANEYGSVVWTGSTSCYGNDLQEVGFDRSYPPGTYTLTFINAENPDYPGGTGQHFVLGSGKLRTDLDDGYVRVHGDYKGNNSLGAPQIILLEGDESGDVPEPLYKEFPLADTEGVSFAETGVAEGYWMHPFVIGDVIEVTFDSPVWISGFRFFAFAPLSDLYLDIELENELGQQLWSGRVVCYDNAYREVIFDKTFAPGTYTIVFINVENPAYPEGVDQHFVLGSGYLRDDLDDGYVEVAGNYAYSNSLGAPDITLLEGAHDANALPGDVDGDEEITDWDAITFERYLAGWNVEVNFEAMDLDGDEEISDWDAITLARYLAGWSVEFG